MASQNGLVYDFIHGKSLKNVDPQKVGEELERIRAEKGTLKPDYVLEAAVDPDNCLHAGFEWDDNKAAHQHRLNQARRLVTSIRVLNSPTGKPLKAFVSVRTPEHGRAYVPTAEALSEHELQVRILQEARQSVEALERRYAHFSEAAEILSRLKAAVA